MPENDPANLDANAQAQNNLRKLKKRGKTAVTQSAQQVQTQKIVDDASLETLMSNAQ
jgi:hypothetical protein